MLRLKKDGMPLNRTIVKSQLGGQPWYQRDSGITRG